MKRKIKRRVTHKDMSYLREYLDFVYRIGKPELYFTINGEKNDLFDKFKNTNCVYMIEDFYIGKSNRLFMRCLNHINECDEDVQNKEKNKKILKILNSGKKLKIKIISDNADDEKELIQSYFLDGYPLVNKVFIYNSKGDVVKDLLEDERFDLKKVKIIKKKTKKKKENNFKSLYKDLTKSKNVKIEEDGGIDLKCGVIIFEDGTIQI